MEVLTEKKTIVVDVNKYRAFDWKIFDSEKECINYELIKKGERRMCGRCGGTGRIGGHSEE